MGFMFGNVDDSGDLDADYLDEVDTSLSVFVDMQMSCFLLFLLFYFMCLSLGDDIHFIRFTFSIVWMSDICICF